jgi:hypothetical protein
VSELDDYMAELRRRVAEAEKTRMLAELRVQEAQKKVSETSKILEEKFGVVTLDQARQLIENLIAEVEQKRLEVEELMDKFEGAT